jgi:hypothetical protein
MRSIGELVELQIEGVDNARLLEDLQSKLLPGTVLVVENWEDEKLSLRIVERAWKAMEEESIKSIRLNLIHDENSHSTITGRFHSIISHLAGQQMIGAIVYDALIVYVGIKANADRVLTLYPRHFRLIYPEIADRIVDPSAESAP